MYESHFGFSEKPFNLTPDSRYLFLAPGHQEAFASLRFGVQERSGFLLLTGEVGTGKTTLIRHFLSQIGPDVRSAVILYPALTAGELFHAILEDLGVPFTGGTLKDAVDILSKALIVAKAQNLKVVVLIDEAQNLKPQVLEQLRLLSNLETEREKLLTVVLVGQPELRDILDRPSLRQLSQRITSRSHLEPLTLEETIHYIRHRLVVAGGRGDEITASAARRVFQMSGGIPRLVNLLCDRALLGAFGRGLKVVDDDLISAAASEVLPASRNATARTPAWLEAIALFALGLLVMLPLRSWLAARRDTAPPRATQSPAMPAAPPSTPERAIAPAVTPAPTSVPTASVAPVASTPAPLADAVRCKVGPGARAAAIAAIEGILGTPGFDSAQATLTYDQWRASKIPAIAPFRTARGPCEAAIVSIDAKTVRVADDSGTYVMNHEALAAVYGGTAILCFVDRDDILTKTAADRLAWARKLLERRGLLPPGAPQTAFTAALGRIGASVGVKRVEAIDGPVLAALYGLDSKHQTGGAR